MNTTPSPLLFVRPPRIAALTMALCVGLALCGVGCPKPPAQRPPVRLSPSTRQPNKPHIRPEDIEKAVHALINREREKRGLTPLQWDPKLLALARRHSQDMAQHHFFSHTNRQGLGPMERGVRAGLRCRRRLPNGTYRTGIAENLFQNHLYTAIITSYQGTKRTRRYKWSTLKQIARTTVDGWMNSPGHRDNILYPHYTHAAIGVSITPDGKIYITQNFC